MFSYLYIKFERNTLKNNQTRRYYIGVGLEVDASVHLTCIKQPPALSSQFLSVFIFGKTCKMLLFFRLISYKSFMIIISWMRMKIRLMSELYCGKKWFVTVSNTKLSFYSQQLKILQKLYKHNTLSKFDNLGFYSIIRR